MILISCRKDFVNSRGFSAKNEIRNYPFMSKLDTFEAIDELNLADQMRGKHVLILIHGFRNPLTNVASSYQRVLKGLIDSKLMNDPTTGSGGGYDLVLGFTWPGFETPIGFFPAVPFANRSGGYLSEPAGTCFQKCQNCRRSDAQLRCTSRLTSIGRRN